MKTYRVTVVRMVEGTVLIDANSVEDAKQTAKSTLGMVTPYNEQTVSVEVVGEPILCENPDGEEIGE